jgi:hypothetical protein
MGLGPIGVGSEQKEQQKGCDLFCHHRDLNSGRSGRGTRTNHWVAAAMLIDWGLSST